ncbi:PmoA family protein [Rubripirellula obstinata]|nr:PmoA family protein [Rubripirellula obstinata]
MIRFSAVVACMLSCLAGSQIWAKKPKAGNFKVEETTDPSGWEVLDGEKLVAGYIDDSSGRPIVYPVIGPSGQSMTRHFPMVTSMPFEERDHPHHRSLWFAHGDVNGIDFWAVGEATGTIVQRTGSAKVNESSFIKSGAAVLTTENDWLSPDGERVLSDVRRIAFFVDEGRRVIDFDILLVATDGDVNFGDTKEGIFGVRVAGSLKVEANQGGKIVNAEGETNADAWGKRSPWVDYSGPVYIEGQPSQVAGITIHDCPSSFGYPARWHVRDYGLFAANPFGVHEFDGGSKRRGIVLRQGKTMRLNYRVVLHDGAFDAEVTEADSKKFANDPRPQLAGALSAE